MGYVRRSKAAVWYCSIGKGADAALADGDGHTSLHKAAQQARSLLAQLILPSLLRVRTLLVVAKDEYYNTLTLKLERKMQKFDLRPSPYALSLYAVMTSCVTSTTPSYQLLLSLSLLAVKLLTLSCLRTIFVMLLASQVYPDMSVA